MLYSFCGSEPAPLPHRLRFADGSTRTDASTFTTEDLEQAGYTGPYDRPDCDPLTETVDWDGTAFFVRQYNADEITAKWDVVRQERNALLQSSDWTQIVDYDLGADRAAWASYRQLLREITSQANPFALVWPQPPA